MDRKPRKGCRVNLRVHIDGRRAEAGSDYIYGSSGGTLVASDDEPAPAEGAEAKRLRRAARALSRLLRVHARRVRRANGGYV